MILRTRKNAAVGYTGRKDVKGHDRIFEDVNGLKEETSNCCEERSDEETGGRSSWHDDCKL